MKYLDFEKNCIARNGRVHIFQNFISQSSVKFLRSFWLDRQLIISFELLKTKMFLEDALIT